MLIAVCCLLLLSTQYSVLSTQHYNSSLFHFLPQRRSIPAVRTGVLVVALIFILNDWGGQRQPARSATLWTEDSSLGTRHSSLSFAAASTSLASSNSTSEIRNTGSPDRGPQQRSDAGVADGQPAWSASSRVHFGAQI